jgi:hypothetical protein
MPLKRPNRKSLLRAAAGCALGFAVVLAWTPVRAAEDDEAPDTKFFRDLLSGIGLQRDGDGGGIDYRERSPLVIPPSRALPPPESSAAASNPSWPVDPEIKKNKELKAASKRKVGYSGDPWTEAGRPLRPDELKIGTRSGSSRDSKAPGEDEGQRRLKPGELGYKGGLFDSLFGKTEENAKFTGEPPRASLTDPPTGYQTPSPTQPYGLGKERVINKPVDYAIEHGTEKR